MDLNLEKGDAKLLADSYCQDVQAAITQGNLNTAEDFCHMALKYDDQCIFAYIKLGDIYARQNRLGDAINTYKCALLLNPKSFEVNLSLGELYLNIGAFYEAADCLGKAFKINSDHSYLNKIYQKLLVNLVSDNLRARRYDAALDECNDLIVNFPSCAYAYYLRACAFIALCDYRSAFQDLLQSLDLDPSDEYPIKLYQALMTRTLRSDNITTLDSSLGLPREIFHKAAALRTDDVMPSGPSFTYLAMANNPGMRELN